MNIFQLRKIALQKALKKTNPNSIFAKMHPIEQMEMVKDAYEPSMSDDQLFQAIAKRVIENKNSEYSEYDRLIQPNKALEAEADKILAANPEKFTGDTEEIFNPTDLDYMYDEDLIPNMIVEKLNAQKAREYDARYRKAYAIYDRQHYQPTMGRVTHIRRKGYIPQPDRSSGAKIPFDERYTNMEDPYAGGIDAPSDVGSGVTMDKYKQFLDHIRSIK